MTDPQPQPQLINDPDDPRIAAYRDVKERDLVGREGRFVAEGEVVLRTCLKSGRHALESVLVDAKRLPSLAPLLSAAPRPTPIYAASQAVLDRIVGFHIHRGILAIGRRAAPLDPAALLDQAGPDALVVVAIGIGNHDNLGGVFRNAAAFGAAAVLLSDCCDPLYRKAIRVSVGASLTVPFAAVASGEDLVQMLHSKDFEAIALTPAAQTPLSHLRRTARCALLLGSEGPGLPAEILARTRCVSIPMAGSFDSLNVATTCGIALHHLRFGPRA